MAISRKKWMLPALFLIIGALIVSLWTNKSMVIFWCAGVLASLTGQILVTFAIFLWKNRPQRTMMMRLALTELLKVVSTMVAFAYALVWALPSGQTALLCTLLGFIAAWLAHGYTLIST